MARKASSVGAKAISPAKAMRLEAAGKPAKFVRGHAPRSRFKTGKASPQDGAKESEIEAKEERKYEPKFENVKSTAEVEVPKALVEQVIGQERAVKIIRKAAMQKRNVLLVGSPGTGKSLLAQAMAELLPVGELEDVLVAANLEDENQPKIKVVRAGEGRKILQQERMRGAIPGSNNNLLLIAILFISSFLLLTYGRKQLGDIITAALLIGLLIMGAMVMFASSMGKRGLFTQTFDGVKLLIDNANRKKAPFIEATGTRAGALLGDCRHDPLQTFWPYSTVLKKEGEMFVPIVMKRLVDSLLEKYPDLVDRSTPGYDGLVIPESEEIYVAGYSDAKIVPVRLLCVNRKAYCNPMRVVASNGQRLIVTPEHKVFSDGQFVEAADLPETPRLLAFKPEVISDEDVLKTFSQRDVASARKYCEFLREKANHPEFGYKRFSKILQIKEGCTRWWHTAGSKPGPVKTVEFLKNRNLLPLSQDDARIPAIARVLGTTFGDGGIAGNLNNMFLSSAEESSLDGFRRDLTEIFGEEIQNNFSTIKSGVNGTGRCIRNSNRAVVRFFAALGAPIGRKNANLAIPPWIYLNEDALKEFFGAYLGNEFCSPAFRSDGHCLSSFDVAMCGTEKTRANRLAFLKELADYLRSYGVKSTSISEHEYRPGRLMWRLLISRELENVLKFQKLIPVRYSNDKVARLNSAVAAMSELKLAKYSELRSRGKGNQYILNHLRSPAVMLEMMREKEGLHLDASSEIFYDGTIYNVTTESGNVFANGILASNSGGLGTPPHMRVEVGMIHRANKGVLFVDEIATLSARSQQELLTAMQEKKYSITGQSEASSGALVKTEPVPTDFILVASGNYQDVNKVHPALRSRIRGYGYEVYMEDSLADTAQNRDLLVQFIAQEVVKDGRIPHFDRSAIDEIISEARRRAGRKNRLTAKLRELGGLIRAAGDVAKERQLALVTAVEVVEAKKIAQTLEQQAAQQIIDVRKEYRVFATGGFQTGRVNGMAVMGDSGIILPIVAEVAPAASRDESRIIATGKLGSIAKEAVENVSAIIKKHTGKDTYSFDIHIQFLQTYEGVEGDSASISVATAVISALEGVGVDQSVGMTGSLSVRGEVLPVGGVTQKVEAAVETGLTTVLIPKANLGDLYLDGEKAKKIKVIPVSNIYEVLEHSLKDGSAKEKLLSKISKEFAG
ncbi:ATP-dependent protease LonB [Candidatus Micrarchaeota archaeon]|nr:ATP-dependent protease LonB [Candidatus Micrarchaeota archaeon]